MTTNINDAELFTEVVRELQQRTIDRNRRGSVRHAYPTVHLAIPNEGEELAVTPSMFTTVSCHDISATGISLVLPCPPGFHRAVVALGEPPHVIHMIVDVVRVERHPVCINQFLVGCRFARRIFCSGLV